MTSNIHVRLCILLGALLACTGLLSCGDDCHGHACSSGGVVVVRHCHSHDRDHSHPDICPNDSEDPLMDPNDDGEDTK